MTPPLHLGMALIVPTPALMRVIKSAIADLDAYNDDVSTQRAPEWLIGDRHINAELRKHGLVVDKTRPTENVIVATRGVFAHTDDCGLTAIIALHNDGLKLRSGRRAFKLGIGDIVVFDDRKPHSMDAAENEGVFVALHLAVIEVSK